MIRDLYDLAAHVGVYRCERTYPLESIVSGIARRLYKDTACGIGFAYHPPTRHVVGQREATYVLCWERSILGPRVVSWRTRGGKRCAARDLPQHVCDYLLLDRLEYPTLRPEGGGLDDTSGVQRTYPYDPWTLSAQGENVRVLRRVERGGRLYLTVRLPSPVHRTDKGSVSVAGYCEGTDADCPDYRLAFPFSALDFDTWVAQADEDGCSLWDDTHGCEGCAPHYGIPVEDGVPTEPCPVWEECPSCEGQGVAL